MRDVVERVFRRDAFGNDVAIDERTQPIIIVERDVERKCRFANGAGGRINQVHLYAPYRRQYSGIPSPRHPERVEGSPPSSPIVAGP